MSIPKINEQEFLVRVSYKIFQVQNKIVTIEDRIASLDDLRKTLAQVCRQRDAEYAQIYTTCGVGSDQARIQTAAVNKVFRTTLKQLGCPELHRELEEDLPNLEAALKFEKEKLATLIATLKQ